MCTGDTNKAEEPRHIPDLTTERMGESGLYVNANTQEALNFLSMFAGEFPLASDGKLRYTCGSLAFSAGDREVFALLQFRASGRGFSMAPLPTGFDFSSDNISDVPGASALEGNGAIGLAPGLNHSETANETLPEETVAMASITGPEESPEPIESGIGVYSAAGEGGGCS